MEFVSMIVSASIIPFCKSGKSKKPTNLNDFLLSFLDKSKYKNYAEYIAAVEEKIKDLKNAKDENGDEKVYDDAKSIKDFIENLK